MTRTLLALIVCALAACDQSHPALDGGCNEREGFYCQAGQMWWCPGNSKGIPQVFEDCPWNGTVCGSDCGQADGGPAELCCAAVVP